jgi:hypothetical protein
MRAFTSRAASLRTSASASARVLYAASWMVQMPRGVDSRAAGSFAAGALAAGAVRGAVVAARVVAVSARAGSPALRDALAGVGFVAGSLLDARRDADDAPAGEPDVRTVGAAVLCPGAAVTGALAIAAGQRAP